MAVRNFAPNAQIESFGNWGTGLKITLEDGTMLMLTRDDRKTVDVKYFTVTSSTTSTEENKVHTVAALLDYLFDLTQ